MTDLAVLSCPTCSAPVPLREGDSAACTHCGAQVAIPPAHRELRALQRCDERTHAEAEALARRMVPAGRVLGWLAWVVDSGTYSAVAAVLVVFIVMLPLPALWVGVVGSHWLGFDLLDVLGGTGAFLCAFGSVAVLVGVVPMSAALGRRRAAARLQLVRSLAARKGRASARFECRNCSAPLEVESSELVERCVYCGSDNLRLPDGPALTRQAEASGAFRATVADAARDDEAERAEIRRILRRRVRWTLIPVVPFVALGIVVDIGIATDPGTKAHWVRAAFEQPRRLLTGWCYGSRDDRREMQNCTLGDRPEDHDRPFPAMLGLPRVGTDLRRYASIQAALRRGERVRVRWLPEAATQSRLTVKLEEQEVELGGGESTELVVPWHGWHTLTFVGSGDVGGSLELALTER